MNAVITTVIGLATGTISKWVEIMLKGAIHNDAHEIEMRKLDIEFAKQLAENKKAARLFQTKEANFTRRAIALSFTFSLVVAPTIYMFMNPGATFVIPVLTPDAPWIVQLLPFFGKVGSHVTYETVSGWVVLWALIELYGLIIGFYFGSGGSRSK